jgi:hypothetical protein
MERETAKGATVVTRCNFAGGPNNAWGSQDGAPPRETPKSRTVDRLRGTGANLSPAVSGVDPSESAMAHDLGEPVQVNIKFQR